MLKAENPSNFRQPQIPGGRYIFPLSNSSVDANCAALSTTQDSCSPTGLALVLAGMCNTPSALVRRDHPEEPSDISVHGCLFMNKLGSHSAPHCLGTGHTVVSCL